MRKLHVLTATMACVVLAGCAGSMNPNTSMYSVLQPVVERTNFAIDLNSDGSGLSYAEQSRLTEWFDALDLRYGDRVSIDSGDGYAAGATNASVAKLASARGLTMESQAPVTTGLVNAGMIRVIVTRSTASVPSCPDWSTSSDANYNSGNHSNHGCAINSNIAAMIADPEDLVRGRDSRKLDNNSGKKAVDAYRAKTGGN